MEKFIFGITGPTGAGKSTVSEIFKRLGVYVVDADKVARAVTEKGEECLFEIINAFGDGILNSNSELNRKALADIVFSDKNKLKLLNTITHKYIKRHIEQKINNSGSDLIAIDGAVIIGSPVMDLCKKLVVVTADTSVRIKRIMGRDGIDFDSASNRIKSQMSNDEYKSFADYIIENNDNNVRLEEYVEHVYNEIKDISETV